jgi:hypothetical protein
MSDVVEFQFYGSPPEDGLWGGQDVDVMIMLTEKEAKSLQDGIAPSNNKSHNYKTLVRDTLKSQGVVVNGEIDINYGIIDDGALVTCYKGTVGVTNNSLLVTYKDHRQIRKQHITKRSTLNKRILTCIKLQAILRDLTRSTDEDAKYHDLLTEMIATFIPNKDEANKLSSYNDPLRAIIKFALMLTRSTTAIFYHALQCLDLGKLEFTRDKERKKAPDIWKRVAFQIAQLTGILTEVDCFSKEQAFQINNSLGLCLLRLPYSTCNNPMGSGKECVDCKCEGKTGVERMQIALTELLLLVDMEIKKDATSADAKFDYKKPMITAKETIAIEEKISAPQHISASALRRKAFLLEHGYSALTKKSREDLKMLVLDEVELRNECKKHNVKFVTGEPGIKFKLKPNINSKFSKDWVLAARGTVVMDDGSIRWAPPKSFNKHELPRIYGLTFDEVIQNELRLGSIIDISRKEDGTYEMTFQKETEVFACTLGCLRRNNEMQHNVPESPTFFGKAIELMHPKVKEWLLTYPKWTVGFEMMVPEWNNLVTPYDTEKMILLHCVDPDGKCVTLPDDLDPTVECVDRHILTANFSSEIDARLERWQELNEYVEGGMLSINDEPFCKLKTERYLAIHRSADFVLNMNDEKAEALRNQRKSDEIVCMWQRLFLEGKADDHPIPPELLSSVESFGKFCDETMEFLTNDLFQLRKNIKDGKVFAKIVRNYPSEIGRMVFSWKLLLQMDDFNLESAFFDYLLKRMPTPTEIVKEFKASNMIYVQQPKNILKKTSFKKLAHMVWKALAKNKESVSEEIVEIVCAKFIKETPVPLSLLEQLQIEGVSWFTGDNWIDPDTVEVKNSPVSDNTNIKNAHVKSCDTLVFFDFDRTLVIGPPKPSEYKGNDYYNLPESMEKEFTPILPTVNALKGYIDSGTKVVIRTGRIEPLKDHVCKVLADFGISMDKVTVYCRPMDQATVSWKIYLGKQLSADMRRVIAYEDDEKVLEKEQFSNYTPIHVVDGVPRPFQRENIDSTKVLCLNGPPGCGKTTLSLLVQKELPGTKIIGFDIVKANMPWDGPKEGKEYNEAISSLVFKKLKSAKNNSRLVIFDACHDTTSTQKFLKRCGYTQIVTVSFLPHIMVQGKKGKKAAIDPKYIDWCINNAKDRLINGNMTGSSMTTVDKKVIQKKGEGCLRMVLNKGVINFPDTCYAEPSVKVAYVIKALEDYVPKEEIMKRSGYLCLSVPPLKKSPLPENFKIPAHPHLTLVAPGKVTEDHIALLGTRASIRIGPFAKNDKVSVHLVKIVNTDGIPLPKYPHITLGFAEKPYDGMFLAKEILEGDCPPSDDMYGPPIEVTVIIL